MILFMISLVSGPDESSWQGSEAGREPGGQLEMQPGNAPRNMTGFLYDGDFDGDFDDLS